MFRGVAKGAGHNHNPHSEIELCIDSSESDALLSRQKLDSAPHENAHLDTQSATAPSLLRAYLVEIVLPLATFIACVLFLAQIQDEKVLSCLQDVAANALEHPRYVSRAPPKPGESFYTLVAVAAGCSILNLFTLCIGAVLHLWRHPVEKHPVSLATVFPGFAWQRLTQTNQSRFDALLALTTSLTASGILLLTSISFGYWSGGANVPTLAVILLASLTPLESASCQLAKAVTRFSPKSQNLSKRWVLQSFCALALVSTAVALVTLVSGPLIWALIDGQGISSLSNLAVRVNVECGMEGGASQAYELLLDGVIRSGPSREHDETVRTPFDEGRTPAVLRLAGDAYYVNAVDLVADNKAIPQWTVYSDEFWSLFHGGIPPNLLSFKATFRFRRKDVLAHIHVPQAADVMVAFPYALGGPWQSADVSLASVHSNLRVLCPQSVNGTREFSSRTFPTNLSAVRKLTVGIAMLGTYCPSERTMYR